MATVIATGNGEAVTPANPLPVTGTFEIGDVALDNTALMALIGEVQASPTANTLLARLKNIEGYNDGIESALASILAKIIAAPATETTLASILAKISADAATETTSAAILAKIISSPATETTLAAILAKIVTGAALESTQVTQNGLIGEVQASPTANTLLDRLKTVAANVTALGVLVGEVQASPTANTLLDRLKALNTNVLANTAALKPVTGSIAANLHATNALTNGLCRGIYVGVSGDVKIKGADGVDATFVGMAAGIIHPIQASQIYAVGTTATSVMVVY